MNRAAITVVLTAYKRERYLDAAIESVLAQRFEDFVLLVIDDASTDSTAEIARAWARRDRRVRLVVNETNLGDFGNRNHGASLVETELFTYHDSDDLMYPHQLGLVVELLAAEPRAGFALSASSAWTGGPVPMLLSPADCYRREYLGAGMFNGGPANATFRTAAFRRLGGFRELGVASDYLFWLRACRSESVLLVPADLFWYRTHPGQHLVSPPALLDTARAQGEAWRALDHPDCPLEGDDLDQARRNQAALLARLTWADLKAGQLRRARVRLAAAGLALGDWLRWLRRPRRHPAAGTPAEILDARGEPRAPAWCRLDGDRQPDDDRDDDDHDHDDGGRDPSDPSEIPMG